jgi:hypothetical protein
MTEEEIPLKRSLSSLRKGLRFKSSRSFFHGYLEKRTRLDFNYSYYMKIEGGKITPSPQVISSMCAALDEEDAQNLMLAYCETLFPERAQLFQKMAKNSAKQKLNDRPLPTEETTSAISRQKFLTPLQVATISESKGHYFCFLILTLSRSPITLSQIKSRFPILFADHDIVKSITDDLERVKLIHKENDRVRSISSDMKFPLAETAAQKKQHDAIDLWNLTFYQDAGFEVLHQKMLLRRVSSRYLTVIEAHIKVLLDLVRASDEIDSEYNDDILMLNISLQKGDLPG